MDTSTPAYIALKDRLSHCVGRVQNNLAIVDATTIGQPYLHHIAVRRWATLVPNISRRAAWSEDNTLPRIHTSTTLIGCIKGYATVFLDAYSEDVAYKKITPDSYKNGYYIYSIPYTYALRPTAKLVYDVDYTNEHWLIAYDAATRAYTPTAIDRCFIKEVKRQVYATGEVLESLELYVEVTGGSRVHLDEVNKADAGATNIERWLEAGYYALVLYRKLERNRHEKECSVESLKKINAGTFNTALALHASNLAMEQRVVMPSERPAYAGW